MPLGQDACDECHRTYPTADQQVPPGGVCLTCLKSERCAECNHRLSHTHIDPKSGACVHCQREARIELTDEPTE